MNVLFILKWGMVENAFSSFYEEFKQGLNRHAFSPDFVLAMHEENITLLAIERNERETLHRATIDKAMGLLQGDVSRSRVLAAETFSLKRPERRPQEFQLFVVDNCHGKNIVHHVTFDELNPVNEAVFDYKPLIAAKDTSKSLMLYKGCDRRWVDSIAKETQDAVATFRSYAGTYREQPLKVMLCGVPRISSALSDDQTLVQFKKQILESITNKDYVPHKKWKKTLTFFPSMGEVVKHRIPDELEVIKPLFVGVKAEEISKDVIPALILFSYRPEIVGSMPVPYDIRETRLWLQHKNEAI